MEPQQRRRTSGPRRTDVLALVGAAAAALGLSTVLFTFLTTFTGLLGFLVITYGFFVGVYAFLVSFDEDGPTVRDRLMSVVMHSFGFVLLVALVFVVVYTLWRGRDALKHLNFYSQSISSAGPLSPLTEGGILHAMLGTLEQVGIALLITIPLGVAGAVFLNEVPGRFSRFVRTVVEAMTALPSIVAGLFIYATLILGLGFPKSGFAAALAISVMMLPIIIRAADVVIRLVPGTLREAALALGASRWHMVWHVVLPTARSGLTTAIILGTARGVGETSPVLITAGYTAELNLNPFSGPQVSLPLATFVLVGQPQDEMRARAFGAAAVLMIVVLLLFVIARLIGGRGAGQLSPRQQRRRARASRRLESRRARRREPLPEQPSPDREDVHV